MIDGVAARGMLPPARPAKDDPLWQAAQKLEATFLSEMLKSAGFGEGQESFGGGVGEQQFSSYLRDLRADEMARAGGIGLAQSLYAALKEDTGVKS